MFSTLVKRPKLVLSSFIVLCVLSVVLAVTRVRFSFDFEQFFPKGDPDLEFFNSFRERFDSDDNFLLLALHREEGVFDQAFLEKALKASNACRRIHFEYAFDPLKDSLDNRVWKYTKTEGGDSAIMVHPIVGAQSLLSMEYPLKTPFGFTTIPAIHLDQPELYAKDQKRIMTDKRFKNYLIDEAGKTLVIVLTTMEDIPQPIGAELIAQIDKEMESLEIKDYKLLGRAFFQTELVRLQINEFILSCIVSSILVFLVMFYIFRRRWGIAIALFSILVGLLIFAGMLGLFGAELDTMALLYPIIMIIVGTSDVIHVMTKYVAELQKGKDKFSAIEATIKEIGMAILLTSTTTAVGFVSLMTSRLTPIQNFGMYAGVGVMLAYVSVVLFTSTMLILFDVKDITVVRNQENSKWSRLMAWLNDLTKRREKSIVVSFVLLFAICSWGISMITTNTQIQNILPKGARVTEDFKFFEQEFSGFRPLEFAVMMGENTEADDYEVLEQMDALEQKILSYSSIRSVNSVLTYYKSMHQAFNSNKQAYYTFPKSEKKFRKYKKLLTKLTRNQNMNLLVSKDKKYARISSNILDIGADSVNVVLAEIDDWVQANIDPELFTVRSTGTGVILDKNSVYVRDSLLQGLAIAILIVSLLMALIYRRWKMLLIALIPNILPLLIAAAILGFGGIALEGGVAICFAVIFGIAVDDTIHILSKFKLLYDQGMDTEEAISITLEETGRAICLTTVILFFGFAILLFSANPPANTVGLLISFTLVSALICDLLIIPIMLRRWMK